MIREKACVASANLPRIINQCGLSGSDRRNKKNKDAMTPSVAKNSRQLWMLCTLFSSTSVIIAASNMPTDWQEIVAHSHPNEKLPDKEHCESIGQRAGHGARANDYHVGEH